jgi:dephospho-CoA kinase
LGHPEVWGPAGDKLMVVGLTGGIASGKTEVATELTRRGALVIDADEVARDVVLPGASAYGPIVREFGESILDADGQIDRAALAQIVFGDDGRLLKLNGITHPAINLEIMRRVMEHADGLQDGDTPAVVIDAALIVDIGASGIFDLLLVVSADEETRLRRMVEDRGMDPSEARDRLSSQISDEKRRAMADMLIENDGTMGELRAKVGKVWEEIRQRSLSLYP